VARRDRDALTRVVLEHMLAGVSTRRFQRTREPVGEGSSSRRAQRASRRSAASSSRARENLDALMSRQLDDMRLR
jgi:hypothetical protein